ncbi:hypothetical protein BaRGS_00015132 [Batillaria attramentaria]|uniref:Uncharacterized protein n=1 Tax=Batillaria attramentaria TaxID=370345 RepID=A0ABD0L2Q3_9CAEN
MAAHTGTPLSGHLLMLSLFFITTVPFIHCQTPAPPGPPYDVTIISCGGMRADIEWKYQEAASSVWPLQGFIVEYSDSHEPGQ